MYRPRGFDRRECPEPPHLLLQQNRFQILNAQNQQNCTSPVLYKQIGNTNMDQGQSHNTNVNIIQGQGHNTNVNIMQTQGQGCSPSAQIIRCRRMLCQTQEFYYMFPSPRRSSISNHPSGCRTMAQRRLMHQRLDSSNTGNSNRFMIDNEENYMQNNMLPGNIFNNPQTNSSIDNNAICGKQQLVQEFESNDRLCSQVMNVGEQQTRQTMSQSRVALSDFINNNSIDIDQSFNGLDDHSYSRKNTDNFSYEDENHTNAAYYTNCQRDSSTERLTNCQRDSSTERLTNCQRDSSTERLKVRQTNSASDEGQRFQNSNVCPFQRNSYINSLRIARNSNGNNTVSTDRSEKQSALNSDIESKLINQHLRTKIEQQASLNHEVKSKLVKESTLFQRALRDLINKEKEKEKLQIEAAKNKKNFRIEGSTITMTTEAKQPDKKSQTIDKSKHLESVVDKTKSNILCSSTSSGQSVQCMNADKRNIPENEPMEKKNFAISANVPTVESKIIVDNAKMVTGKSREKENQNKATGHQQVNVKSSSECLIDGQVRTQTAPSTESDGPVRTQTTPSTESEGQVRIQTAQSAEASYNLALKQWQKQNLCKTKTSDLQKTNTDDLYHQTHQQLKTLNSGRNIEMDSSNKKNCDSCLEALAEISTRSENIHSANTKNSNPSLEALAQSSVRSMNIHSSRKKNCDPCLEAQKQNSANCMNIHSNTKNCDPHLEAQKQSSANSMNIHSNTKNCDPHLEAQKQNSANAMNIYSNTKNCDPHLEADSENTTRPMNIHSNTKNCDPCLEAQKQNFANSMNIHSSSKKNCDPCLEAQKQNSANAMNIHSSSKKNCDPCLEAQKQNSANSMNIHLNKKNCDPHLEAVNENTTKSMKIHSNTQNYDPCLEAQKQSSSNSLNIHSNKKNCDPGLKAQKQNSGNSMNIHSNTKNCDPRLEAHKQNSAYSLNFHPNTKNCDPRLEASKQNSTNSLNIHSNTKNCDPRLEASKQNFVRSVNIHPNTKNCDPRLEASKNFVRSVNIHPNTKNCDPRREACKQNSTISNDALNTNSFHQNAEICTTNNHSYSQSAPLLHDRKNVDCNQSLDKLQSINPECPRKNPGRENESSENSCQDRKSSKDTGFRQALVDVVKAMFDLRRNKHFEEKIIARNQGDKASNNDNKLDGQKLNQTISENKDDYNLVRQSRNQPNKLSIDEYKHARQTVKQQIKPSNAESKQIVETRIQAKSIDTYQDNSQNGRVKHMQCERSSNFLKTSPVLSKTVKHTKETNEKPTTLETTQSSDKPLSCNSNANDRNIFTCVFDTDNTRTRCDNSDVTENTDLMDENKHLDEYRKTSDLLEKSYSCQTPDKLNKESNSLHTDKISDDCFFSSAENSEDDRLLPDEKDKKSVKENYEDEFEDKCLIPQSMSVSYNKERNCDSKGSNNITEKTGVHGNNNCKTPSPSKMSPKIQSTGKDFSFLELGYCPLALPLGCYAYEEDADRDENNNDSPKRLDFDPDIVATNKHMRMLCDEKYNHDNTEILTPWVIRYLDEIPKPTIRKEFLDKMDLELNENEFNHHHILQASIASPENDDSDGEDIETDHRESPRIIPLDSHYVKDTRKTHQIRSLLNSSLEDTLSDLNSIPVSDDECDWSLGESEDDSSTDNYSERVPGDYSDEVPGESDQNEDKTDCAVGKSNHSKKSLQSEFDTESSGNRTEVTDNTKDENHKHLFQRETLLLKDNSVDNKANNSKTDPSLNCKIQNENDLLQKEANFHEETDSNKEKYSIGEPSKKIDSKKRKDEISNIDKKSDHLKEDAGKGDNLMLPQGTKKLLKKKVVDTESSSTLSTKKTRTKKRFSPTENQLFQEAMNFLCSGKIKDNNEKIIDCFSNSTIRTRQKSSNIGKDVEQGEARKKKQEISSLVEKDIVHADNVKKKRCCKPSKVKELKEKQKNILDNLKSQKEIISLEKKQEDNGENCDSIGETKDNCEPKTKTTELNKEVTKASKDRKYLIDDTEKQDEDKLVHSSVVMPVSEQLKGFLKRPEISMDVLPSKQKDLPLKRLDISPEESEALTGLLTLGESHKSVETQTLYNTDSGTCSEKRTILNSLCEVKSDRTTQNSLCEVKSDETYNKHSSDKILQKSELENEIDHRINKLLNDVRGKMLNGDKSEENGLDKGKNKQRGNALYHNKEEQKDNKKGKHKKENCKINIKDKQEQNGDVCKRHQELKNLDEQKDKQEQNLLDDNKDKELQNPEGHQMDKQEHNLVDNEKYNQEKILKGDQKNEKDKHEQNLKSDICDGQEQNSKEEHDHHALPFLIAAATENDRSVPIDTTVQSGSTEDQTVTASNHTQSPGSNEYLEHSDSDTIPLVEKTVVEEKTPGKWLIPILERLNIDISKGRLIVTKTAQKLCIKTGTLIKSTCSYSSQTSVVQGKEERNIDNCAIDMIAVGDKSDHLGNESQNHDELNIENVNSSITKSKKRKKGKNLSDNSMELRSQGTTNTKKWKKLKESDDMLVPRITRNRALQVSKNPTINLPSKKGNLKKKKTSGKKLNETDAICPEINDISKEDDIDKSTESFCHKKSDSSNKNSKGKGTKRKLEFDGREEETYENTEENFDKMDENQMKNKPPETKKKKIPKCRKMLNKSSTLEERSTESISPAAELPEQMNNLGCDAVTELDNQKKSENGKKQKVKKNIMKKSSNKPLKSLSTPKTKSLKKISGAKSKKKTMANGDKVCFRLVTEPSEQKIVRLKAEALKKLYATKICAYCKQTVPSRQFKHHVKIHHPYRCAKCGLLFSNKEERLGHRREKHSSHQYHCIICNKIFDEKWHYGHHIKSLVHRNNREIYRRAINIMKSCIGLDLGPASKDLMLLEDSHTDSTQKSLVPMEQSVNLFCSTEDVTLSYHEPEVQHLLNELSDVKSVMLNLVKSNSDFSFGQSSFFDCQIGRQVTQNFISDTVYSSEDAQFNDLTPCSENASLISQNSLAIENNSSSSSSTLSFDDPSFRACLTSSSQQDSTGMPFDNPNFRACLTNVSQQNYTGMPFDNPSFRACLNNRSQQDSFGMPFENPNFRACLAKSSQQDRTGMPFENPSFRACPTITSQQDYTGMPFDDPNFRVCLTNTSQRDNTGMSIDDPSFRTGLSTHQANSTGLYFDDPNVRACLTANQPNSTGMSFDDPHFKACLTNNQPNSPGMSFDNPHFRTCLTNDTCFRACNTSEGKLQNDALSVVDPNLRSCQTKIRQPDIDKTTVISKSNGSPTNNDMLTDAFRLLEEEGYFENDQITSITSDIDLSEMVNNKEFTNLTRTPLVIEQKSYLPGEPIEQYPYLTGNQVEQNPNMPGIPEEQCPNLPGISEEQNPGMPGIPLEQYHNLSSIPVEKSQIDIINGNTESAENYSLLELSSHIPINAQPNIPMAHFSDQQQHFNFDSNNNAVGENVQHQIVHNSDKVQCQIDQNGNVQCQNIEQFKAQGQNVYEDERRNVQDEYLAISQEIAQEEGMEF